MQADKFNKFSGTVYQLAMCISVEDRNADDASEVSEVSEASVESEFSEDDELCVHEDKFLIFTTGSNTYSPHQIGMLKP